LAHGGGLNDQTVCGKKRSFARNRGVGTKRGEKGPKSFQGWEADEGTIVKCPVNKKT